MASAVRTGRQDWDDLPEALRTRIEARTGGVVAAQRGAPGFSVGFAGVLDLADGTRVFVKAGDGAANRVTADFHRAEAVIARALPPGIAPRMRWWFEHDRWVVLGFDAVDGRHPSPSWPTADLDAVLAAHAELARLPAPAAFDDAAPMLADMLVGWSGLIDDGLVDRIPAVLRPRLGDLRSLEGEPVRRAATGGALAHLDLRADNVLITDDGTVRLLDWPHARRGAPWLDLAFFAPTVAVDTKGAVPASSVVARSPLADGIPHDALLAVVAGWVGRLLWRSAVVHPDTPVGLPAFMRAQADAALPWLLDLLDAEG